MARTELSEASGLVLGRVRHDVLWSHNDRGGEAVIYAVGLDGRDRGAVTLNLAENTDWEDIAAGVGPDDTPWLYVGDIGDNQAVRETITVWRLPEPQDGVIEATAGALSLRYPDGAHDAETLLFDPASNDLFVLTKSKSGTSGIYRAPAHASGVTVELERVGEVVLGEDGLGGDPRLSGGDIAPSGDRILLRSRNRIFAWARPEGTTVAETLLGEPCAAPVPKEPQGEALAATDDGFWTLGEQTAPILYRVDGP